jgi:hypothetical protein
MRLETEFMPVFEERFGVVSSGNSREGENRMFLGINHRRVNN